MTAVVRIIALLLTVLTVSGSQLSAEFSGSMREFYIEKLGLTMRFPAEAYVTDRTVDSDYPPLEHFGLTADQLEVQYKKGSIHCNAIWFPDGTDMTEIIVAMTEDDDSRAIFQLRDYDRLYQQALADSYSQFSQQGMDVSAQYTDASLVDVEQAVFVRAHGTRLSQDAEERHLHYMTVVNGQRIEITLVEHCDLEEDGVRTVSAENEAMMDEIIRTMRFDELKNEFVAKNTRFMTGAYVVMILSALLIVSYLISRIRVALMQKKGSSGDESVQTGDVLKKTAEEQSIDE